jgi:hypothetical protein
MKKGFGNAVENLIKFKSLNLSPFAETLDKINRRTCWYYFQDFNKKLQTISRFDVVVIFYMLNNELEMSKTPLSLRGDHLKSICSLAQLAAPF